MFFLSIQPIENATLFNTYSTSPIIFLNNYYPVLLLTIFIIAITGRVSLSLKFIYLLFSILGLVNRMKIIYRDFPLIPFDLKLIKEAGSITASSGYAPDWNIIILIIIGFILLREFLLRIEFPKMNIRVRVIKAVLSVTIFMGLFFTLYSSKDYYFSIHLDNDRANYNEALSSNLRGFHYYFLYNVSAYDYTKPADYDKNKVAGWIENMENENQEKADESLRKFQEDEKPNIIFIMGEAFTDISTNPVFNFNEGMDPLAGYKAMEEECILSGQIVAPVFGAGTEYTEYDVITGNKSTYQSDGYISAFRSIKDKTYSLGWFFKDLGYDTYGMHTGEPWFYNRQNAYKNLGLDNNYFKDDFDNPDIKGLYISDKEFGRKIKNDFENHKKESSNPLFYFSVTIQNHGPYLNHKYSEHERFDYETTITCEPKVREQFDNLFVGIKDMSDTLKDMGDFFLEQEEPVILVFFGDHKPSLGEDYMAYRAIGHDVYSLGGDGFIQSRTSPYLIWANENGKKYVDTSELSLSEDNLISANYLGVMLLDMLDIDSLDPYYSYFNDLRRELPVLSRKFIVEMGEDRSTNIIDYEELTQEDLDKIEKYKEWQYHRLTVGE